MLKSFLNDIEFWTNRTPYVVHGMVYGKVQIELLILKFKILSLWILISVCLPQAGILKFWFKRIIRGF
jgi:hypothetical protein